MINKIKELLGKSKLKMGLRTWRTVFQIRDPWLRRDFENFAKEYEVKCETAFDGENNIMYYVVVDGGKSFMEFLSNFIGERKEMFGYFKRDVFGMDVVHIAEK